MQPESMRQDQHAGVSECRGVAASAPPRILLLRTGRHLRTAMDALRQRYPGCHIGIVGTPGSQPAIEQAGVAAADAFIYEGARFQPLAFFFSRTSLAVRRWGYDRVAILWNDPAGTGSGNVDRAACLMSPRGYDAITPDGTLIDRALMPQVRRELLRLVASVSVGAVLGLVLYLPAMLCGAVAAGLRRVSGPVNTDGNPAEAGLHEANGNPAEAGRHEANGNPAALGLHVVSGFSRTTARH